MIFNSRCEDKHNAVMEEELVNEDDFVHIQKEFNAYLFYDVVF